MLEKCLLFNICLIGLIIHLNTLAFRLIFFLNKLFEDKAFRFSYELPISENMLILINLVRAKMSYYRGKALPVLIFSYTKLKSDILFKKNKC